MLTSPDNLWSPDAVDPYNLVVDLGLMQDTVQDALADRARTPVSATSIGLLPPGLTPGEIAWVTSPSPGFSVQWTGSSWVRIKPEDTGWVDVPLTPGFTALPGTEKPQVRKIGSQVFLRGGVSNAGIAANSTNTIANLPSAAFYPASSNAITHIGTSQGSTAATLLVSATTGILSLRVSGTLSNYYVLTLTWLTD